MDLRSLKVRRVDQRNDLEHLEGLNASFQDYVDLVRRVQDEEVTRPEIEDARYAIELRLQSDSTRFLEWHDGEQFLNPYIFGLVENPDADIDSGALDESAARAHAKFRQLIQAARETLARTEARIAVLEDEQPLKVTRQGVYFAGQTFDALRQVQTIVGLAENKIVIIDNWVDETVLDLVAGKPSGTTVEILTQQVSRSLSLAATKFNKQYGGLAIRTSGAFHDRFIIVDDVDVYHFGASIKDAGKRTFMFSRIEEESVIGAFRQRWQEEWAAATIVV